MGDSSNLRITKIGQILSLLSTSKMETTSLLEPVQQMEVEESPVETIVEETITEKVVEVTHISEEETPQKADAEIAEAEPVKEAESEKPAEKEAEVQPKKASKKKKVAKRKSKKKKVVR